MCKSFGHFRRSLALAGGFADVAGLAVGESTLLETRGRVPLPEGAERLIFA
jgi:hypothetical protein